MSRMSRACLVLAGVGLATSASLLEYVADARGDKEVAQVPAVQVQVKVARPVAVPVVPAPVDQPGKDPELNGTISFPKDSKAKKSLEAAQDFIKEEAWAEAAHVLQALLNKNEDIFVEVQRTTLDGKIATHWTSIRTEANRLIGSMPPNGLEVYELQYGARARNNLSEAKKPPEQRATEELRIKTAAEILADVAQRYLHTKAGAEAANLLGTHHLDRGRPVMASLCFERLLNRDKSTPNPVTLLKAALAYQRIGDKTNATQTWQRLARLAPAGVRIGDRTISLDELQKEFERMPSEDLVLNAFDWPLFKGNPSRSAQGIGSTPFLDEDTNRWEQPTIRNQQTRTWLDQAIAYQESRQQAATLPAFFPIAAGGKLVFRSYFGIHAVDLKNGKLIWEQDSDWSMDRMAADASKKIQLQQWVPMYINGGTQSILFENSTLGTLSTDNSLVYAVDDLAVPPHPQFLQQFMWGGRPNFGPLDEAVHHNKLQAIELDSGKLKWKIGGRGGDKDSLHDSFFLGPPLPLGGKLYVLNEKNSELRLICLDNLNAREPTLSWIQTLAAVRDPVMRDVGRRMNAANLAYGDGILVCPTNAGAILGVDLLTHSLVWAHPYREATATPEPNPQMIRRGGIPVQFGQNLSPDWKCSAPIIQDGKVVFTAPDGASIHCLNLRDGTLIWKANRTDDLYLGGVYHGKVVLVGKQTCRALALADGKLLWSLETGLPSGHGVACDKVYYLPLKSASQDKDKGPEICAIDIDTGRVVAHTKTRKKAGDKYVEVPGNLLFYEGKVISQTVHRVTAYPQLKVKLAEMNARIDKNPKDPVGLTERAELRRHNGDVASAVDDLRTALTNNPDPVILPKARQLLFESLTELFQRDFNTSEKYLEEYKEMCRVPVPDGATPEERLRLADEQQRRQANFLCLVAKGREQQGNLVEAFKSYMEFGGLGDKTGLLTVLDEPAVKARPDVWAQGRIAAMVAKASPEKRQPLEDEIASQWRTLRGTADTAKLRNFVAVFGSLFTVGKEARLELAERLLEENAFLEAELHLLQVRRQSDPVLAARAVEMLARLMTRKGILEDAAYWYRILGRDFAKTVVRDGKTGEDFLNDLATDKRFLPFLDEPVSWNTGKVKAREEFGQFQQVHQIFFFEPEGELAPFFQRHRLAFNMNFFQIKMIDRTSNEERWSQNLSRQNQNNLQYLYWNQHNPNAQSIRFPYLVQGHMVVFNLGLMVYGFDLVDRKVLWEKNLFGTDTLPVNQIIPNALGGLNAMYPDGRVEKIGQAGPFEPGYVCLQTRQGLLALDPITGTTLWTKANVPSWTHLFGDAEHLYHLEVRADGSVGAGRALRAHDGVGVEVPDFSGLYQRRVRVHGRTILVSEVDPQKGHLVLRLNDVHTGKDVWKKDFSPNAMVVRCEDPELAAVVEPNNNGKLTVINLRSQTEVLAAAIEPKDLEKAQGVTLLQDSERFYLAINGPPNPQINPWGGPWSNLMNGMRGVMVNGNLYAFERATGKIKWRNHVPSQVLILEQYKDLPMLLFTSRSQRLVNGGVVQVTATKSIDKKTGKLVYDKDLQNNGTQFHTLNTNLRAGTVDLISHNMKIQHYMEK